MLGRHRQEEVCSGGRHRQEEVCSGDTGLSTIQLHLWLKLVTGLAYLPSDLGTEDPQLGHLCLGSRPPYPFCSAGRGGSHLQTCLAGGSPFLLAWHLFGFDTKKSLVPRSRKVLAIDETGCEASDSFIDLVEGRFLLSLLP